MIPPNTTEWSLIIITSMNNSFDVEESIFTNGDLANSFSPSIISDAMMKSINIYVNILICGGVAVFGTVNNVINMVIFYRLGLKDSMSVGLIFLSFTDFLHSSLIFVSRCFSVWETFFQPAAFDPIDINYVCFDWIRDILYLSSGWITTFLSIERCVCVVFPFKVKQIFTRYRCLFVVIAIYVFHASIYMPVFVTQRLGWITVEKVVQNDTILRDRLVAIFSDDRPQVDAYVDYADGIPFVSQAIVLASVVWMIHGLRMSSKMRLTAAKFTRDLKDDEECKKQNSLSYKNSRLMKVVLFLAIILIVCNTPRFIAAYVRHLHPEVMLGRKERNLFVFLWAVAVLFTTINTTVNIFVYLIINSSYRAKFKDIFKCY